MSERERESEPTDFITATWLRQVLNQLVSRIGTLGNGKVGIENKGRIEK